MLYVTTRNNRDAFTAQRVLRENRGPDGGLYLPFHAPSFTAAQIDALAEKPFNQCVAEILNLLFRTRLNSWDVDCCAGRSPVRLQSLGHRIMVAESWHNPEWDYNCLVKNLVSQISGEPLVPGSWVKIAVRIAVLVGIFGELKRSSIDEADIAMVSGDFSAPISAWYARQWGLPVGNIICCCNENNSLWDLLSHGQLRTDSVSVSTFVTEADVTLPAELERLVYACGGCQEVERFLDACRRGGMYCPPDAVLARLRKGMFVSVISSQRVQTTIPSVYKTHAYLLSAHSALAYGGLMDYRAKSGQTRHALVLADKSPASDAETVSKTLGITAAELKRSIL